MLEVDLINLYGLDEYESALARYQSIGEKFSQKYGKWEFFVSSPGRIEICGNHTDHNGGLALASSINLDTVGAVAKSNDGTVRVESQGYEGFEFDCKDLTLNEQEKGKSIALVKGVMKYLSDKGYKVGGFNLVTESTVFKGAGVSSSASFELLIAKIVSALFNEDSISEEQLIRASCFAENVYFGKPCGSLDQTAIGLGGISFIDFSNSNELIARKVNSGINDLSVVIVNSGGDHSNLTYAYGEIREEMESVASFFGAKKLIEVKKELFDRETHNLLQKVSGRAYLRAKHFFEENQRVTLAVQALESGDRDGFFSAINRSGLSSYTLLQNCYVEGDKEQRIPLCLAIADNCEGVLAKRVHGGGFAGTVLLFVEKDKVDGVKQKMSSVFGKENVFKLNLRSSGAIRLG